MTFADAEYAGKRKTDPQRTVPDLTKNTAQLVMLFALSNLWMALKHLLTNAGEVRP